MGTPVKKMLTYSGHHHTRTFDAEWNITHIRCTFYESIFYTHTLTLTHSSTNIAPYGVLACEAHVCVPIIRFV